MILLFTLVKIGQIRLLRSVFCALADDRLKMRQETMNKPAVDVTPRRVPEPRNKGFIRPFVLTLIFALSMVAVSTVQPVFAQYGGRTATVEVAPSTEEVLAISADVQGRVVGGPAIAITAVTTAITEMESLRIGDMVQKGQIIARQDSTNLRRQLELVRIRHADAKVRLKDAIETHVENKDRLVRRGEVLSLALQDAEQNVIELEQDLQHEQDLIAVNRQQYELLSGKSDRAKDLSERNALSVDAAETAFGSALNAQQQLLSREATITRKSAQLARARTALSRTRLERDQNERDLQALNENQQARIRIEIRQLEQDIKNLEADIRDTEIASPSDGQIGFLAALQRGFSREGDVIARIIDPDDFEIEAEIPVEYMGFLMQAKQIRGRDLQGNLMSLKPRAVLPVQNARTGTQTVRFAANEGLPKQVTAENAVIVIKVPTTSPAPVVVVPKDAVLPVPGGHVVYIAADGVAKKTAIQLGDAVGENFVVMSGLAAGVDVIIRGNEALTDGKKIKIGGEAPQQKPQTSAGEAWTLNWTTQRGPASADLVIGKEKSTFNDEEITVVRAGDSVNFIGKLYLPFGTLELDFQGQINGNEMTGKVTLRGLPSGREPVLDFTGTKDAG